MIVNIARRTRTSSYEFNDPNDFQYHEPGPFDFQIGSVVLGRRENPLNFEIGSNLLTIDCYQLVALFGPSDVINTIYEDIKNNILIHTNDFNHSTDYRAEGNLDEMIVYKIRNTDFSFIKGATFAEEFSQNITNYLNALNPVVTVVWGGANEDDYDPSTPLLEDDADFRQGPWGRNALIQAIRNAM